MGMKKNDLKHFMGEEMKRKVEIGTQRFTEVYCHGEPGFGGAHHEYTIVGKHEGIDYASVSFQTGSIKEAGVNGCHNEDLIVIVVDRLRDFQSGDFSCRENALAITKLEEALHWLNHRTIARTARGVEGKSVA